MRSYKKLRGNNIEFHPGMVFNPDKARAFFKNNYPDLADELISFVGQIRRLILYSFAGLCIIITVFLVVFLNSN